MKLSVCIPVYNVAPYIERCARSLFGQTCEDMEFVFVDDCSPDDSIEIVGRVLKDFPNRAEQTKILRHEKNKGAMVARRTAFAASTGELIAFCDPDDWVDAGLYEKMMDRLIEADADAVMCQTRFESAAGSVLRGRADEFCLEGPEALRHIDDIPGLSSMVLRIVRRELLESDLLEWPTGLKVGEDLCMSAQLLAQARRFANVAGEESYHYWRNDQSQSHACPAARVLTDHESLFDILSKKLSPECNGPVLRYAVRTVLYVGLTQGLLTKRDCICWRNAYAGLGGKWDWSDKSLWGQRMMKIAGHGYWLARLAAPFVKGKIDDYL